MKRAGIFLSLAFLLTTAAFAVSTKKKLAEDDAWKKDVAKVKKLLYSWNDCINKKQTAGLKALYADSVQYYTKKISAESCIASKDKWLQAHPAYQQQIRNLRVYFPEEDSTVIVTEFKKTYTDNGSKTVTALLCFQYIQGSWKISRETDVISEVAAVKKSPAVSLPNGKFTFARTIWEDAREAEMAFETVRFDFTLEITVNAGKVTGSFTRYSGYMRSIETYTIKSGKMENGFIEVNMTWDQIPSQKEALHFKIMDKKTLVCIDKDKELSGQPLKRPEEK